MKILNVHRERTNSLKMAEVTNESIGHKDTLLASLGRFEEIDRNLKSDLFKTNSEQVNLK